MCNRWRVLVLVYLIAATTVGTIPATNNEETVISDEGEYKFPEAPLEYSNDTEDVYWRANEERLSMDEPLAIQLASGSTSEPCGTPTVQCLCPNSPYRTMDGTCNNLIYTARGSAGSAFSRLQKGRYANEKGQVITKTAHGELPLARVISSTLFDGNHPVPLGRRDGRVTMMLLTFGRLLAIDAGFMTEAPIDSNGDAVQCCTQNGQKVKNTSPNCLAIHIPPNDPVFSKYNLGCINMKRARVLNTAGCSSPEINQVSGGTPIVDMSNLYGSSMADGRRLRSFVKGQLKARVLNGLGRRDFLPLTTQSCPAGSTDCYDLGDPTVNQDLALVAFQTLLLREHNRIAKALSKMRPKWSDESLFQEARRINIAQYNHIIYNHFLPVLVGKVMMEKLHLKSPKKGFTKSYDPKILSGTMSEFSAAASRSLQHLVSIYYQLVDEGGSPIQQIPANETLVNPGVLETKDNLVSLIRGLSTQKLSPDATISKVIRRPPNLLLAVDAPAVNIQRGRDYGLPTYNDMRHYCGLRRAKRFEDLLDVIPKENVKVLKTLYKHVQQIDFYVGGLLEKRGVLGDKNALVGHTFGCVLGEQFRRWRFGDRYFYDLKGQAGSFTHEQINGIKKTSLAAMLCENLSIKKIQRNPFIQISKQNKLTLCKNIQRLDLSGFRHYKPKSSSSCAAVKNAFKMSTT